MPQTESGLPNQNFFLSKINIIAKATKAVPFVKYALGLVGIIAFISLIKAFGISFRVGFVGTLVTLFLMTILFLLSKFSLSKSKASHLPAVILVWFFVIIFIATMTSLFGSVFFNYPLNLCKWLDPECQTVKIKSEEAIKNLGKDTVIQLDKEAPIKHSKANDKDDEKKILPQSFTLSIQLRKESEGFKEILYNGQTINTLPESTTLNPRIEINNYLHGGEIMIITKSRDTCRLNLPTKPDTSYLRIVPTCI
jgi:hypothetical protein